MTAPDRPPGPASSPPADSRSAWFAWDWSSAGRGTTYAIPACVLLLTGADASAVAAVAVSVIPGAVIPLARRRGRRIVVAVVGALIGVSVLVGSLLATTPWLAVLGLVVLSIAAALVASRWPQGMILLTLGLPLAAVGFSYPGLQSSLPLALLLFGGSVYAWLVSLPWPDRPGPARAPEQHPGTPALLGYGVRVGLAGALCAAIGFALDFDHVGWAAAAALLVMRPSDSALELRAIGRPVSVLVGAAVAIGLVALATPRWVLGIVIVLVVVAATATARSRWYVTPAFTTFLVFLLLLSGDPAQAAGRFWERLGETVLGVGVACVFGLLVPGLLRRRSGRTSDRPR